MNAKLCKTSTTEVTLLLMRMSYAGMQIEFVKHISSVHRIYTMPGQYLRKFHTQAKNGCICALQQ